MSLCSVIRGSSLYLVRLNLSDLEANIAMLFLLYFKNVSSRRRLVCVGGRKGAENKMGEKERQCLDTSLRLSDDLVSPQSLVFPGIIK